MLSILLSTLETLIFLFIAAFVIGFLTSGFAQQSSAQDKAKTVTSDR